MNASYDRSQANLKLLGYMALGCQAVGTLMILCSLFGFFDAPRRGVMLLVFGMALGGWAGNLGQILDLKRRLTALEERGGGEAASE